MLRQAQHEDVVVAKVVLTLSLSKPVLSDASGGVEGGEAGPGHRRFELTPTYPVASPADVAAELLDKRRERAAAPERRHEGTTRRT